MVHALSLHTDELRALEIIAVGGSLGRLEAGPESDFDCLLVAAAKASSDEITRAVERTLAILADCGVKMPKAAGIYRSAIQRAALLDPAGLGSLEESAEVFGKRMQFLLDARPLSGQVAFESLQADILRWYGSGFHSADGAASWTYLLNDLMRYLHAYAGWQQYKFGRAHDDSWQLRQAKLRSSRIVTFAGLLVLLGESNHRADKLDRVLRQLVLTPLQRLAFVMQRYDGQAFVDVLQNYERVHARLQDSAVRAALINGGPESMADIALGYGDEYEEIRATSARLMEDLTDFVLSRRGDWDARFFRTLLF